MRSFDEQGFHITATLAEINDNKLMTHRDFHVEAK